MKKLRLILTVLILLAGSIFYFKTNANSDYGSTPVVITCPSGKKSTACQAHPTHGCGSTRGCPNM